MQRKKWSISGNTVHQCQVVTSDCNCKSAMQQV